MNLALHPAIPTLRSGVDRVHLVGIGGAGMNGIAQVLLSRQHPVSGSDLQTNAATTRLAAQGATIYVGHQATQSAAADYVVVSSAVAPDNPEVLAAQARGIPILHRAQMLAALMQRHYGIAIAGTHGKTTVSSLVSTLLIDAGLQPTYVIGGELCATGQNAASGASDYVVAEADESDGSFVHLSPRLAVITNLDADHLVNYGNDFARLRAAFIQFAHRLPVDDKLHVCVDHPAVCDLLPAIERPLVRYGFAATATVRATDYRQIGAMSYCQVTTPQHPPFALALPLPGRHNLQNALATVSIGLELAIPIPVIQDALRHFQGVKRRFNVRPVTYQNQALLWIDDYAHHPAEMQATLAAIQTGWPERRLIVIFQPHRYTRTQDTFAELVHCLAQVEHLILCAVYAAGESPITGADSTALCNAIQEQNGTAPLFIPDLTQLATTLPDYLRPDDIVLTMGAGNIDQAVQSLFSIDIVASP